MGKILIIEDSSESFELARRALGNSSQVEWAKSFAEATRALEARTFDIVLLDISLPDGDGFRLCSLMQANDGLKNTPVIILSGRNTVSDKIMGFSVGADDFMTKPFDPLELKARVDARLRRRENDRLQGRILQAGELQINRDTQSVSFSSDEGDNVDLDLTPLEFKVLLALASRVDHVHSREELLASVWGSNVYVYSRSVDTHVSKLRKKLGEKAAYIQSVHGAGYRFSAESVEDHQHRNLSCLDGFLVGAAR